jgi:hypothetical protein
VQRAMVQVQVSASGVRIMAVVVVLPLVSVLFAKDRRDWTKRPSPSSLRQESLPLPHPPCCGTALLLVGWLGGGGSWPSCFYGWIVLEGKNNNFRGRRFMTDISRLILLKKTDQEGRSWFFGPNDQGFHDVKILHRRSRFLPSGIL